MTDLEMVLPIKTRTKERPRFGAGKVPFNTAGYRDWRAAFRELVERLYSPAILTGRLRLSVEFRGPTEPQGDVDGLVGSVMDACQPDKQGPLKDAPLEFWLGRIAYLNDSQIREFGFIRWVPGPNREIYVLLEEIPVPDPWTPEKKPRSRKTAKPA